MPICKKCGAEVPQNEPYCPHCGVINVEFVPEETLEQEVLGEETPAPKYTDRERVFGMLAYIGILVLIPAFAKNKTPFMRFHLRQGTVLCVLLVLEQLLKALLLTVLPLSTLRTALLVVFSFCDLFFILLAILGVVHVLGERTLPLPLLGRLARKLPF